MYALLLNTDPVKCRSGWKPYGRLCVLIGQNMMTWSESQERCKQHGGELVSVADPYKDVLFNGIIGKYDFNTS